MAPGTSVQDQMEVLNAFSNATTRKLSFPIRSASAANRASRGDSNFSVLYDSSDRFRALALHGEHHASPPIAYACACTRAIAQTSRTPLTARTCVVVVHCRSLYLDREISSKRARLSLRIYLFVFLRSFHMHMRLPDVIHCAVYISSTTRLLVD